MTPKIIFQDSFLVSGIMCFESYGAMISNMLDNCLEECKEEKLLPPTAHLDMDFELQQAGARKLIISITNDNTKTNLSAEERKRLHAKLKEGIEQVNSMFPRLIFQDSFLVAEIMCFESCGAIISKMLDNCLKECKEEKLLPPTAHLVMDAEPQRAGIHKLIISITNDNANNERKIHDKFKEDHDNVNNTELSDEERKKVHDKFKDAIAFDILNENGLENKDKSNKTNWQNIIVNLLAVGVISSLSLLFSPSILLTIGLTTISFLATGYTARNYLRPFFKNIKAQNPTSMITTVSLGWLLALAHTLHHAFTMPLAGSFSMIFMSYIMPVLLITVINGMDELRQQILNKSKKMHLQGIKMLFPQMAETYSYYQIPQALSKALSQSFNSRMAHTTHQNAFEETYWKDLDRIQQTISETAPISIPKSAIKSGMTLKIKQGECFPVDCFLLYGKTVVDPSLLTGEHQQIRQQGDPIPAGAINLTEEVIVYTTNDSYHSAINQLLFYSNRAKKNNVIPPQNTTFNYLYLSLIVLGVITSLILPFTLGILTLSLSLQNLTGILFAICPCTLAIAYQLPRLINIYQRNNKGITVREENLCEEINEFKTIVFDKTGTLTTGNSQVAAIEGLTDAQLQRVYLLEEQHGAGHPIAKAIINFYEANHDSGQIIRDIKNLTLDENNRGLSATVQGKQIHIGSAHYLNQLAIEIPTLQSSKLSQGFTPIYIAEGGKYQGVIYIKHEVRHDILAALNRLKAENKEIIMLTGDSFASAHGFNQQNGNIFDEKNIHADQTPKNKDEFLATLMQSRDPKSVCFIGDGLNDTPCAKTVSEKGGISFAMTANDKTSFFTDICLNGSLNYLFEHNKLNQFLKKNILQNQGLLMYSTFALIAFIISFSLSGIAVSPIIPLIIMASTTLMVLFNSYRMQLAIDCALDPKKSWLKQLLASDLSIALLSGSSLLFTSSLLISTLATGGFAFPVILFTAGAAIAISSACLLTAVVLLATFITITSLHFILEKGSGLIQQIEQNLSNEDTLTKSKNNKSPVQPYYQRNITALSPVGAPKELLNQVFTQTPECMEPEAANNYPSIGRCM